MPLAKQVVSWPLTGGLDTKNSPLVQVPGTHLTLDDVRQPRDNEWQQRPGHTNDTTADRVPGSLPPLRALGLPGGSVLALRRQTAYTPSPCVYQPSLPASATRWSDLASTSTGQLSPSCWSRTAQGGVAGHTSGSVRLTGGVSDSYCLAAWTHTFDTSNNLNTVLSALDGGDVRYSTVSTISGLGQLACAAAQSRICLFYTTTAGNLLVSTWNTSTGAVVALGTVLIGTVNVGESYLDAFTYPGSSTITVVYRTAGNQLQFIEYNPVTGALATSVTLATNPANCLCLLPDPDSSGTRFVGVCTATPDVRVLRLTSGGGILTDDQAEAATTATAIAGCAYQAGAGWMIVYRTAASGLRAVKKRSAVISAAVAFSGGASATILYLDSNAWRETGTDAMRVIAGLHAASTDAQDNFYELAFAYEDGSSTMTHHYREPQARLLPLNAGPVKSYSGGLCHAQRVSADRFIVHLTRLERVVKIAGAVNSLNTIGADRWQVDYVNTANVATLNQGPGVASSAAGYIPAGNLLQSANGGQVCTHGASGIPLVPSLVPSTGGGALTPLNTYQYIVTCDWLDEFGSVWRSPPSTPASVTLAGTENTVGVTVVIPVTELTNRRRAIRIWRTKGNGSIFQLLTVSSTFGVTGISISDTTSDANLASAEFLPLDIPTALTPAVSHTELFGGRLWAADRDFGSQLWFSKKIQSGFAPEFAGPFQLSLSDSEGPITNLAAMDDKLVVFKASAIYVIAGDGPDNTGAGQFPSVLRIDSDVGSKVGTPVVSTGSEVFFVSDRGIYRMTRDLAVDFVGAPVDRYLNQSQVQTPEVVTGAVFSPATNEIRFQTTNYRLVFDRLRGLWMRDVGGGGSMTSVVRTVMVGTKQVFFKSNGDMWFEGAPTVTSDDGATYTGIIRSAWIRLSGIIGQRMRLYQGRLIMTRTAGGGNVTPTMRIYYDNDDSIFESFSPSAVIGGAATLINGSAQPRRHRCQSFSLEARLPTGDSTMRLDAWAAEVGMKRGAFKNSAAERWV